METLNTFLKVAKERGYDNDEYRNSENGPKRINTIINCLLCILTALIIWGCGAGLDNYAQKQIRKETPITLTVDTKQEAKQDKPVETTQEDASEFSPLLQEIISMFQGTKTGQSRSFNAKLMAYEMLSGFSKFMITLSQWTIYGSLVMIAFISIIYFLTMLKRWRHYERDVLSNDIEAAILKRRILRSLDYRKQLRNAKRAINNSNGNDDDPKKHARVEALKELGNMNININTRQSLDGFTIVKSSRITFNIPFNEFALLELENLIKDLNLTATRKTGAKSKFGVVETSEDRTRWTIRAQVAVKDKYLFDTDDDDVDDTQYESAFPLHLLVDRREQIKEVEEKTAMYARRSSESLAMLLTSMKYQVKFIDFVVSASTVTYTYEWTFDTNAPNVQNIPKVVDKNFGLEGSEALIAGNHLKIVVPLQKEYRIPLDVATLYRGAFGGEE